MYVWYQMFIIVAIIYHTFEIVSGVQPFIPSGIKESYNCHCDVLQVNDPDGYIGNQNFTRQDGTLNEKPYYTSTKKDVIYWSTHQWVYDKYNDYISKYYDRKSFSFENECKNISRTITSNGHSTTWTNLCWRESCSAATKDLTREFKPSKLLNYNGEYKLIKQIKFQSKNPCKFPFMYNNVTYKFCTKVGHDKLWCATKVDAKNLMLTWGNCSDSCPPKEDDMLKDNGTLKVNDTLKADDMSKANGVGDESQPLKSVVVILIGIILLIGGIIIGYCCLKKEQMVTHKNAEVIQTNDKVTDEYSLDTTMNRSMINSEMILNDQAGLLSYSGEHEIEKCKFGMGKKLGGGSFGGVYEGITEDPNQPGQKMKVAIKTVNNPRDESQVYALMCEIKVLEKIEMHPNLVNMIGACTAGQNTGRLWLLLEYCPCGDMKNFLNKNREVFEEGHHQSLNMNLFLQWGYGIANGMEYLSSMKIMHGDLAARNILISNLDSESYVAKITDFGLSKAFYDKTSYAKQDRRNVPWKWMDVHFLETSIFTMSSDVWSFGVVFWEMLSIGRTPYAGGNADDMIKRIKAGYRLPPPDEISHFKWLVECYNQVTQMCWHPKPKQRSSFSDLVQTLETYFTPEEKENLQRLD